MRSTIMWLVLLGSPAMAEGACQIAASAKAGEYVKVPMHAAPTSTSEALGLAPDYRGGEGGVVLGARFVVTEMRNGWAFVTGVTDWSGAVPAPDGWINAINIVLVPQTNRGFAVASPASKVVWEGTDWPKAEVLLECKGEWGKVLIRADDGAGSINAWVRGFCDDPTKPCEGVTGDVAP